MLDYDEMLQLVLKMRDEALEKDRRRKMLLKRSAAAALSACAAGAVIVITHNNKAPLDPHNGNGTVFPDSTAATEVLPEESTDTVSSASKDTAKTTAAGKNDSRPHDTVTSAAAEVKSPVTSLPPAVTGSKSQQTPAAVLNTITTEASAAVTAPAQTADTAVPAVTTIVYDTERSFDMKKLATFMASLAIASNAATVPGSAVDTVPARTDVTAEDLAVFEEMDNGTLDTDVNMDGVFDIRDPYDLFAYDYGVELDQAVADNIAANADFNGSGSVGSDDSRLLLKYFLEKGMFSTEYLDTEAYESFEKPWIRKGSPIYGSLYPEAEKELNSEDFDKGAYTPEELEELFAKAEEQVIIGYEEIRDNFSDIFRGYISSFIKERGSAAVVTDFMENGFIDLDIDGSGSITFEDVNTYWYFIPQKQISDHINKSNQWIYDMLPYDSDPEGLLELRSPDFVTSIPDDQWEKCEAVYKLMVTGLGFEDSERGVFQYVAERTPDPDEKYYDCDYYDSILEGSGSALLGLEVKDYYEVHYPLSEKMTITDHEEYSRLLNEYCNKVNAGKLTPADANGDGKLSFTDILATELYISDNISRIGREDSALPGSVWDFFDKELDLNNNGTAGERTDLDLYKMMIYVYVDSISETEEIPVYDAAEFQRYMKNYISELRTAKENPPVDSPVVTAAGISIQDENAVSERIGDANCDGKLDIADAVSVLQYISNSSKYPLSDLGRANADIDGTAGITGGDVTAIQKLDAGIE